jgi:hypothetical protein
VLVEGGMGWTSEVGRETRVHSQRIFGPSQTCFLIKKGRGDEKPHRSKTWIHDTGRREEELLTSGRRDAYDLQE